VIAVVLWSFAARAGNDYPLTPKPPLYCDCLAVATQQLAP
jgi:hypothetical protein